MLPLSRFNLCLAVLGTFATIFLLPCSASAKLGEDLPALVKRFGSNYQPLKPLRWTDAAYKFESKNCQVEVALKAGHSVSECYFCFQPLVNGKPPENIWRGIRIKNAPDVKWKSDGHGGFVSMDGHFDTWYNTENLPEQSTCAIVITDYYTMKEGQLATVQVKEANQAATMQAANKPALPTVRGIAYDPAHRVYSYPYFQAAEAEGKQVYAAKSYSRLDCKVYDYPGNFVSLAEGEPLHVISVDPETYSLTVSRAQFNTIAHLPQDCVTIR